MKSVFITVIGVASVALGAAGLLGGWGQQADWFVPRPEFVPPALSALCFLLAGAALLVPAARPVLLRRGQSLAGVIIFLVAAAALVQDIAGLPHNTFQLLFPAQPPVAGPHPLGMSPNAATVFLLCGLILALGAQARSKWSGGLVLVLLIGITGLALLDLAGNLLRLDTIYSWYEYARMSAATAAGVTVLSAGLWAMALRSEWLARFFGDREDRKITLIAAVIVLFVALSAALAGFSLMAVKTEEVLTDSLRISLANRLRNYQAGIEDAIDDAVLIGQRPRLKTLMAKASSGVLSAAERREVEAILDNIKQTTGVSAVALHDAAARLVGERGSFVTESELRARLPSVHQVTLFWHEGVMLKVSVSMLDQDRLVAILSVDIPLPALDRLTHDVTGLGKTGTMAVCAPLGELMQCFPNRINNFKVVTFKRDIQGQPLAMSHALDGKTGVISALDAQGRKVIAAYGPIGKLGLGMVVRARAAELYQPIRSQFQAMLPLLLTLVFGALLLLRWQITPLAGKLVREIGERKSAEQRLGHLAHHDILTGLPNRILFNDRLSQALIEATRHEHLAAVLFLDLDRFKTINDTLGHEAGNQLLKAVAGRLSDCLRAGDTVARLGGDEFALVLPDITHVDHVSRIAEKIQGSFGRPFHIGGRDLFVTASMGITLYPFDDNNVDGLLKNADIAMYRAKEQGRNNYQYYTAEMNAKALEHLTMENQLRHALERNELLLHYQPQVDLMSGEICGVEAMLRWQHPEHGLVRPDQFIPLAEETGLIVPIGEWVLGAACAQNRAWRAAGLKPVTIAVNLSPRQFIQQDFSGTVRRLLADSGLESGCLELELTENIMMQHAQTTTAALRELSALGVRFAIDDFGTGYSSLNYLKRLPIHSIKIGPSFMRDVATSAADAALVAAIIALAHSINVKVVAEGVETQEQLVFLRAHRCDAMQGFYFSQAVPAAEFARLLREGRRLGFEGHEEKVKAK
ncbi:MAG: EAL domain-containing protein [Gammaproteobacteria bacterium]|nr:EAL domain-containing protein [Gammaproteobacteria bacterium]